MFVCCGYSCTKCRLNLEKFSRQSLKHAPEALPPTTCKSAPFPSHVIMASKKTTQAQKAAKTDVVVGEPTLKVVSLDELKVELEKLHKPWMDEFSAKLDTALNSITVYVDGQISQVSSRIDSLEARQEKAQGQEVWAVIQGLPKNQNESAPELRAKVDQMLDIIGVPVMISECFRMGRAEANPNYIPIVKLRLESREQVQQLIKNARRLQSSKFDKVFVRESKPLWARNLEFNIRELAKSQGMGFARGRVSRDGRRGINIGNRPASETDRR